VAYQNVRARYASDGTAVIPQQRLLLMLYDRLVLDLEQGEAAMVAKQPQIANKKLVHAQQILFELHAALDTEIWPQGARLKQLYLWFCSQLIQANTQQNVQAVRSVLGMVRDLNGAWHSAFETAAAQPDEPVQSASGHG
jgi:flagellar protein FliS